MGILSAQPGAFEPRGSFTSSPRFGSLPMLSYRHAFHAGNHADVFKHWVLSLLVGSLMKKEKPFFFLDTHSGAGRYSLKSAMASKNREYETGIERLWNCADVPESIGNYLNLVRSTNPGSELAWYPGSPRIVRPALRAGDRMVLCELHPADWQMLTAEFVGDRQVRVEKVDGYQAVKALLPPLERRGLVHIDPAYELKDEHQRILNSLKEAYKRWATGIFALWYPVVDRETTNDLQRRFERLSIPNALAAELSILPVEGIRLAGSGMLIINPPWQLEERLRLELPWLAKRLAASEFGGWRIRRLSC